MLRAGLIALISSKKDLVVLGQSGTLEETISLAKETQPDVVIMDLHASPVEELSAPDAVRAVCPKSKIVMLIDNDEAAVFAALSSEADGYCLRECEFDRIYAAVQTVTSGEFWLDSVIARKVVKALLDTMAILATDSGDRSISGEANELSRRELEVLDLVAQGMSNQKIAQNLKISAETVKSHIRHIMKKLTVNDRTQAAVEALKRGLI
jgi:DNA-binding NarL/FixJ family response regulator